MPAATAEILETIGEKPAFTITVEDGWIGSFSCVDDENGEEDQEEYEDDDDDEDDDDEDDEDDEDDDVPPNGVPPKGGCTGIHVIFTDGGIHRIRRDVPQSRRVGLVPHERL